MIWPFTMAPGWVTFIALVCGYWFILMTIYLFLMAWVRSRQHQDTDEIDFDFETRKADEVIRQVQERKIHG